MPSANIHTPRPRCTASASQATLASNRAASSRANYLSRALAIAVSCALLAATPLDLPAASAPQTAHKKRKSNKPAATPCRTGCMPNTSAPEITAATPEDEAAQRELSTLARALHNASPGAYDKLAAFAGKNAGNVWGARAALALGYDDYNKNRTQPAMVWLTKAKSDTLLADYVLYWTAQTQRVLKQNGPAFAALQKNPDRLPEHWNQGTIPRSLRAPSAMEAGKPQAAIEALEAYKQARPRSPRCCFRCARRRTSKRGSSVVRRRTISFSITRIRSRMKARSAAGGLQQK